MLARTLDDLLVYRKSLDACAAVSAFREQQTLRADYELRAQLGSASAAVPANIAEGFGQQSDRMLTGLIKYLRASDRKERG